MSTPKPSYLSKTSSGVLKLILAAIAGGLISGYFDFVKFAKSSEVDRQETYIERISVENDKLREDLYDQQTKHQALFVLVQELQNKIILLESAHTDLPFPMWLKDIGGRMLAVNPAYEKTFLAPRGKSISDYIGFDDFAVWPNETAEHYRANDQLVYSTQDVLHTIENIPIGDTFQKWEVIKYPRKIGNTIIGIAGIAIPQKQ